MFHKQKKRKPNGSLFKYLLTLLYHKERLVELKDINNYLKYNIYRLSRLTFNIYLTFIFINK